MGDVTFVDRRARELASDPTLNIALEASAGTGKTRVLVDRYVHLVEEGASPRHILAITFTRKAAGEMRSRIIEELRKRPELWKHVRSRLFEIHITTIDAFCLGLLREFPLEAGLDPDVKLIDAVDAERLLEESIDEAMAEARRGSRLDYRFLVARFGEALLKRGTRDFLQSRLLKEEILSRYVDRVVPKNLSLRGALERFSQALGDALRGPEGVERFLRTAPEPLPPGLRALGFALRRAVDRERIASADVEEVAAFFLTRNRKPRRRLPSMCRESAFESRESYETHRDQVLALAPFVARAYRSWLREKDLYAIRELHRLYREALARFTELKSARAVLDFGDVLSIAVALLENRGEFSQSRFRLEARYHHLLIDEFQDTNEVQWRLVRALIESWGEGQGLVQEAILSEQAGEGAGKGRLREPSLFIVGDRKQSIYGWRDARVEVLEKAARHLLKIRRGGGHRLTLRTSFRATGELLSFLNDLFDELPKVRRDLDWSFQYREEDHFPIDTSEEGHEAPWRKSPVAIATGADLSEVAAAVADEVVRVLNEEGRRPKDVAILFRSRASYRIYEEALAARGVPAYVYRGLGFFDSPEVRDVEALVRFLAEPASELRAAELARSRFIAVSDRGLAQLASARGASLARWLSGSPVSGAIPLSDSDREAVVRAARLVPEWLRLVDRIPPSDLIERALDDTSYAGSFAGAEQSFQNLKKVLAIIRRADNRGYLTLSRLADYLESASTEEESEAVLEAVDAVNLMTVHAAKGLEFDTVFLVNLQKRTRKDTSLPRIRELPDGRIEVSALAATEPAEDAPNRVEEEEKRLLYVALTRARRRLVLASLVPEDRSETSFLRLLPEGLYALFGEAARTRPEKLVWGAHEIRVLHPVDGITYREERAEPSYRLSLAPIASDTDVLDAADEDELGGRVHLLLERGAGARGPNSEARDFARALAERDEWTRLMERGAVHYRVPFSILEGGCIRRGAIGCLVVGTKTVTVVDYRERGLGSLELQLRAAAAAFPGRHVEGYVFYPDGPTKRVQLEGDAARKSHLSLF